jgi:hypothetical protein
VHGLVWTPGVRAQANAALLPLIAQTHRESRQTCAALASGSGCNTVGNDVAANGSASWMVGKEVGGKIRNEACNQNCCLWIAGCRSLSRRKRIQIFIYTLKF